MQLHEHTRCNYENLHKYLSYFYCKANSILLQLPHTCHIGITVIPNEKNNISIYIFMAEVQHY